MPLAVTEWHTYNNLAMLIRVNQRLNKVVVILGQHIITLTKSKLTHNVVREVRKPPRHVFIGSPESVGIAELLAEQLDLVENSRLVRSNGGLAHRMRDDASFARVHGLVGGTREVLRLSETAAPYYSREAL